MAADLWLIIVTVSAFGISNLCALVYLLGSIRAELRDVRRRTDHNETSISGLALEVARMKGREQIA